MSRTQGGTLKVKGAKQVDAPVKSLDARDLGWRINPVDSPHWSDKRDVALINVMVRAGLRISKALALKVGDVELGPRAGKLLVREGKGLKSRALTLSSEARDTLKAYLQVQPKVAGDLLFLSRTHRALDPRDVQRMVSEAARRAGIKFTVTPHTLRHSFATRFLAKNQGDIATLVTILGHANINTTARYRTRTHLF